MSKLRTKNWAYYDIINICIKCRNVYSLSSDLSCYQTGLILSTSFFYLLSIFPLTNTKWNHNIPSILKVILLFTNSVANKTNDCIINQCHFTPRLYSTSMTWSWHHDVEWLNKFFKSRPIYSKICNTAVIIGK